MVRVSEEICHVAIPDRRGAGGRGLRCGCMLGSAAGASWRRCSPDRPVEAKKARFHYLWHIATILILGIAAAYAYACNRPARAGDRRHRHALAAAGWTLLFALPRGYSLRVYPQWALFGTIALLGLAGLM